LYLHTSELVQNLRVAFRSCGCVAGPLILLTIALQAFTPKSMLFVCLSLRG